jgi:hypothetical protein
MGQQARQVPGHPRIHLEQARRHSEDPQIWQEKYEAAGL